MGASQRQPPPTVRASRPAGFTIIETLVVLAIAGVIFLIVFQAIPALERSGRNNQRRQDIQTILEAVSHYELNHSGDIPGSGSNFLQYYALTYYDATSVKYLPPDAATTAGVNVYADAANTPTNAGPETSVETVDVYNYQKCDATNIGQATSAGAGYNDFVALFSLESGNNVPVPQCQQL